MAGRAPKLTSHRRPNVPAAVSGRLRPLRALRAQRVGACGTRTSPCMRLVAACMQRSRRLSWGWPHMGPTQTEAAAPTAFRLVNASTSAPLWPAGFGLNGQASETSKPSECANNRTPHLGGLRRSAPASGLRAGGYACRPSPLARGCWLRAAIVQSLGKCLAISGGPKGGSRSPCCMIAGPTLRLAWCGAAAPRATRAAHPLATTAAAAGWYLCVTIRQCLPAPAFV